MLSERGLDTTGTKAVLLARLTEAVAAAPAAAATPAAEAAAPSAAPVVQEKAAVPAVVAEAAKDAAPPAAVPAVEGGGAAPQRRVHQPCLHNFLLSESDILRLHCLRSEGVVVTDEDKIRARSARFGEVSIAI